jgi:hypothetical protein
VKSGGKVGEGSEVGKAVGEAVAVAVAVALSVGEGAARDGVGDVSAGSGEPSSGSEAQAASTAVAANRAGKRQALASLERSITIVSTLNHVDTTHAMSIDTAASPEHLCRVCHRWPILSCPLRLHSRQPLAQAALGTS